MAIVHSIKHLKTLFHEFGNDNRDIYMTSGGFDPIHVGHVRCIQSTYKMANDSDVYPSNHTGIVVVIVNADSFLIRKKGYAFMPLQERMEIIDAIEGVDFVVPWETDGDQTVIGALSLLKPKFFTKGGDRFDASTIPEWEICQQIGCEIITGVGGEKIQSSSTLVEESRAFTKE
jgi:bifunctional ADP-heptose synthase (sugar kinase/adenylyltransferase)